MKEYEEILLGKPAFDYLRYWLEEGGLTLSKLVLENVDLNRGIITTALPEYADPNRLYEFNDNIIHLTTKGEWEPQIEKDSMDFSTDSYCIEIIRSFLESKNSICITEEYSAVLEAPYEAEFRPKVITYRGESSDNIFKGKDDEVYHILRGENISEQEISKTIYISKAPYPPLICHLMYLSNNNKFTTGRAVTKPELKALSTGTEKLIIAAYDGDAYLVWHRIPSSK